MKCEYSSTGNDFLSFRKILPESLKTLYFGDINIEPFSKLKPRSPNL